LLTLFLLLTDKLGKVQNTLFLAYFTQIKTLSFYPKTRFLGI